MLNDTQVRSYRSKDKLYRVSDSHGLCIEINPNGSKLWRKIIPKNINSKTFYKLFYFF